MTEASARPLIGFGRVQHRRLRPVLHSFAYPGYFVLLPMRALAGQGGGVLPRRRFGLLSFCDRDHGEGGSDALAWIETLLRQAGVADADGEVWLQTYPRVLGFAFKPVSFWYAHRADGSVAAVVAEVNNTFGERHCYVLPGDAGAAAGQPGPLLQGAERRAAKVFHVSPFCTVAGEYRFRFIRTGPAMGRPAQLLARIDLHDADGPLLETSISGRLQVLTRASLARAFFGQPLMTLGVVARIHWQALRLFFKRVPFHGRHPPVHDAPVPRLPVAAASGGPAAPAAPDSPDPTAPQPAR